MSILLTDMFIFLIYNLEDIMNNLLMSILLIFDFTLCILNLVMLLFAYNKINILLNSSPFINYNTLFYY